MTRFVAQLACCLALATGCLPPVEEGSDAGPSTDGGTSTDGGQTGCGSVANSGGWIPETAGAGSLPAPQGGTIADGIYELTGYEIYQPGSIDPYVRRQTLKFENGHVESVDEKDMGAANRSAGTFTSAGTTVTMHVECPQSGDRSFGYTATANEFRMIVDDAQSHEVHVFTKK